LERKANYILKDVQNFPQRKAQAQMASQMNSIKYLKKNNIATFHKLFQKNKKKHTRIYFMKTVPFLYQNQRHPKETTDQYLLWIYVQKPKIRSNKQTKTSKLNPATHNKTYIA